MSQGLNQVPAASERISPIIHWEDCCASQQKSMPPPSQGLSQLLISALSKKKGGADFPLVVISNLKKWTLKMVFPFFGSFKEESLMLTEYLHLSLCSQALCFRKR